MSPKSPWATCLPDLLHARARACPDRIAVRDRQGSLTFGELQARSRQIGNCLQQRFGVAIDQPVGIFMESSVELMAGVWGILNAGSAYLPLSPEYPDARLRYLVQDAAAAVVLADESLRPRLSELLAPGTLIVTPDDTRRHYGASADPICRPDSLAYIIYTSGSTGRPKGIMIEHRSVVNQLLWLAQAQGLDGHRTVLQKTPLSFDAAQWEILAAACGSRVLMADPGAYRDPERLIDLVIEHKVTTLQAVPTLWQALVDTGRLAECASLEQVFSGGEALSRALAVELVDNLPGCDLVNLYGPSECTINTSAHVVDPQVVRDGPDPISIGRPVAGTNYLILDADRSPVGTGQTGELHIGGVQLARGYLHRDDLTEERFIPYPCPPGPATGRLYRSGDLARWNPDGTVHFVGRADNQVKLRGFRVELDEIRCAIEGHDWVKRAAVIVRQDPRTGTNLVAVTELNAAEATLMDQGSHGAHHQSKQNKVQIRAQLSNPGLRDAADLAGRPRVYLPGAIPTARQRRVVFARKTYRFFEGDDVTADKLLALLDAPAPQVTPRPLEQLTRDEFGQWLRFLGQFHSAERLLPKYGYASPGSLYATQLYLELSGVAGLAPGHYYYHPAEHALILIRPGSPAGPQPPSTNSARLRLHLIGRRSAVEPVYRNNIQEVLQIEAGHLLGLLDAVLPSYGLSVGTRGPVADVLETLECADDDYALGSFEVESFTRVSDAEPVEIYLQTHPGRVADLPSGQYRYAGGRLERVSDELVRKRHVIAINQEVYQRSSFGISLINRDQDPWARYVALGRALQRLQLNDLGLGLMSAGYSSETGNDLPSARRIATLLVPADGFASYFAVGGPVSRAQRDSEGMKEDIVHMRGPAEMIRDALAERLPHYMVPNRVHVVDALPLTVNGKVDLQALREFDAVMTGHREPVVAPRTPTEEAIALLWKRALRQQTVSVLDDFFAFGGDSLIAVGLISRINRELGCALPVQELFESSTIEALAQRVDRDRWRTGEGDRGRDVAPELVETTSRFARLSSDRAGQPIFCWPGLGGYPMSLRLLAARVELGRPFFGIQAHGINVGESPYPTLAEMAARDVQMIRRRQTEGPYTLWGYSFGARVAFEAAQQLEQAGERVENLYLIAPGRPMVGAGETVTGPTSPRFDDKTFVSILFSVFAGSLTHPALAECLRRSSAEETFVAFICERFDHLERDLVQRIVRVVRRTLEFEYTAGELIRRQVYCPVTVFTARGDEVSFIEAGAASLAPNLRILRLDADHYSLLREGGVGELSSAIQSEHSEPNPLDLKDAVVPHVNIKHMPRTLAADQMSSLVAAITSAVQTAFACDEAVVSIALESVSKDVWNERVYIPEIVNGRESLVKVPNYRA